MTTAVILAAGRGTRMRRPDARATLSPEQSAAADLGLKALIPVRGRPFLDYVLSSLADAGVEEAILVVPPGRAALEERYGRSRDTGRVRLRFAVQEEPRGSADALISAEGAVASREFLVLNSDNLYPAACVRALREQPGPGLPVFERERLLATSNCTRERAGAFAELRVSPDGWLEDVVEKPGQTSSDGAPVLLSMNLWRFSSAIFEACREVPLSSRGEKELPQAVRWAIRERGARFRAFSCGEGVLDISTRADVAEVEARLSGVEARP